jgi:hypothetical protein
MAPDEGERLGMPASHVERPADDDAGVLRQVAHLPGGPRLGPEAVLAERVAEDFGDFAGGSVLRAVGDEDQGFHRICSFVCVPLRVSGRVSNRTSGIAPIQRWGSTDRARGIRTTGQSRPCCWYTRFNST